MISGPGPLVPLVVDGPTLTFLVLALVFLVAGAALALAGVLRARRAPEGRTVTAVVALGEGGHGADFPQRRPDFTWTDDDGTERRARSARTLAPGLWAGTEVTVRLDPRDEGRAHLVSASPPRRELVLLGSASALVGLLLALVGLNAWLGTR